MVQKWEIEELRSTLLSNTRKQIQDRNLFDLYERTADQTIRSRPQDREWEIEFDWNSHVGWDLDPDFALLVWLEWFKDYASRCDLHYAEFSGAVRSIRVWFR